MEGGIRGCIVRATVVCPGNGVSMVEVEHPEDPGQHCHDGCAVREESERCDLRAQSAKPHALVFRLAGTHGTPFVQRYNYIYLHESAACCSGDHAGGKQLDFAAQPLWATY